MTSEPLAELRYDLCSREDRHHRQLPAPPVAADYVELVWSMNRDLLTGVLVGLGPAGLDACLEPTAGSAAFDCETPPSAGAARRDNGFGPTRAPKVVHVPTR